MLRSALVALATTILFCGAAAPSQAETFEGLHMTAQVGEIIGDGAQVGFVPVTVTWSLDDPPGVYGSCFGDWEWGSAPIQIDIREGQSRDGRILATLSGSGKTGTVSTTLPGPTTSQDSSFTAWLSGSVSRPANLLDDCAWGEGSEDTRSLDESVRFSLPYPDKDDCVFTVEKIRGSAGLEIPGTEASIPVNPGSTFSPGATLVVKPGGWVELSNSVQGGTVIRVVSKSKVTFQSGDCTSKQKFSLKLWFGRMWSKVERLAGKKSNQIEVVTDNATMGVRGTIFEVQAKNQFTQLKVRKGRVQIASKSRPSSKRNVGKGQSSTVRGQGLPSRPRR